MDKASSQARRRVFVEFPHALRARDRRHPATVLMDVRDFPKMVAGRYHVHNVEIVDAVVANL